MQCLSFFCLCYRGYGLSIPVVSNMESSPVTKHPKCHNKLRRSLDFGPLHPDNSHIPIWKPHALRGFLIKFVIDGTCRFCLRGGSKVSGYTKTRPRCEFSEINVPISEKVKQRNSEGVRI